VNIYHIGLVQGSSLLPMYFLQALSGSVKYIICVLSSITGATVTLY